MQAILAIFGDVRKIALITAVLAAYTAIPQISSNLWTFSRASASQTPVAMMQQFFIVGNAIVWPWFFWSLYSDAAVLEVAPQLRRIGWAAAAVLAVSFLLNLFLRVQRANLGGLELGDVGWTAGGSAIADVSTRIAQVVRTSNVTSIVSDTLRLLRSLSAVIFFGALLRSRSLGALRPVRAGGHPVILLAIVFAGIGCVLIADQSVASLYYLYSQPSLSLRIGSARIWYGAIHSILTSAATLTIPVLVARSRYELKVGAPGE